MRNFHQHGIDTRGRISGKIKIICPQCNDTRGHKGNKSLSVDLDKGLCYCHHCGYKLYVPDDAEERLKQQRRDMHRKPTAPPQHFRRPTFNPARMQLSENLERYWTTVRCLPQELLRTLRITEETVRLPESSQEENCICFNYFENGTLVNTKYRSALKHFMMVKGAELIPYNVDSILGTPECIITEGEFDAAAVIAAGRKDVISVPAGAQSNLTWLDRFVESHFEDKQAIYIAVDEDPAGQSLRQELTRRLGVERCRIVHFGEGCKDANEHLVKYGAESLRICIEQAEEVPLEGIFTAEDCRDDLRSLYENGLQRGADTGWDNFDEHCTFEPRRLLVMTGRPGDGKSEFTDELVLRLCLRHEWKIAFFSPENMPIAYHLHKLAEKLTGHRFTPGPGMTEAVYGQAVGWLDRNVSHILPDDGSYGIDHILEKARQVVRRKGVRIRQGHIRPQYGIGKKQRQDENKAAPKTPAIRRTVQTKPFHGFYLEANGPDPGNSTPKASQRQRRQRAKPTLRYPEITVIPQWQCLRWFSSFIVSNPAKSHKRLMAHTTLLSSGAEMETDSGINLMLSPKGVAFRPITVKIVVKQMNIPITPPGLHMTL